MRNLKQRINFVSLSLLFGIILPFSKLIAIIVPQDLYVIRLVLISFAKNLLPFIILAKPFKTSLHSIRFDRKKIRITDLVLLTAFAFVLCFSCNIVPNTISYITGIDTNNIYTFNPLDYLAMALFPAIIEETAFRQIIAGGLCRYGTKFAVLMSATLFALSHTSLTAVMYAFLCGIILGILYIRTCSIFACMTVHFMCNAVTITCGLFPDLYNLAVGVSIVVSIIILAVLKMKKIKILPQKTGKSSILPFKIAFTNPLMIVLLSCLLLVYSWSFVRC